MDIEARVVKIEKRLAALEERVARLERLVVRCLAAGSDVTQKAGVDKELIELRRLIGPDEEVPPPSRRH